MLQVELHTLFGTNAILAFALSNILITLFTIIRVPSASAAENLHAWGYHQLFATWLSPVHASLAYAISIVVLNLAFLSSFTASKSSCTSKSNHHPPRPTPSTPHTS